MLNNSQGSQGNNDLQTAQNAIAILIDQISNCLLYTSDAADD